MNGKWKKVVIVLAMIIVTVSVSVLAEGYFFSRPATIEGNVYEKNLNGYHYTCGRTSAIYKLVNGSWEELETHLPGNAYYLDGDYVLSSMCDIAFCERLPKPVRVKLIEYKWVGVEASPTGTAPAYYSFPLSGEVKIEIKYYSDQNCQVSKTFTTVINR